MYHEFAVIEVPLPCCLNETQITAQILQYTEKYNPQNPKFQTNREKKHKITFI